MRLRLVNHSGRPVRPHNLRAQTALGIMVAYGVGLSHRLEQLRITSLGDGAHSHTSLHYAGDGFDIGFEPGMNKTQFTADLKADLGMDYDVVLEDNHIHVEYQPRKIA